MPLFHWEQAPNYACITTTDAFWFYVNDLQRCRSFRQVSSA